MSDDRLLVHMTTVL